MAAFHYADEKKKKKLPLGPLPWPTDVPAVGYVPIANPWHGRWTTGGVAEFLIASGMVGGRAEESNIQACVDIQLTGGMVLRITQNSKVCRQ